MADLYTTADLITQVKRRGQIPTSQNTWDEEAILEAATEELHGTIMPFMIAAREEYFVWTYDSTLSTEDSYPIHSRAMGMMTRDVTQLRPDGTEQNLPYLDPDQVERRNNSSYGQLMYYLEWNTIKLVGGDREGSLRQRFYMRPGSLIETSAAGKITAVNTGTYTVTLDVTTNPFAAADLCDFVKKDGGHEYRGIDFTVASVSGSSVVFSPLPSGVAVGDWLMPAEKSCLPQLPRDLQPLLVQSTLVTILDAMGDPRVEFHRKKQAEMIKMATDIITPRNHGESKKIVSGFDSRRTWP